MLKFSCLDSIHFLMCGFDRTGIDTVSKGRSWASNHDSRIGYRHTHTHSHTPEQSYCKLYCCGLASLDLCSPGGPC